MAFSDEVVREAWRRAGGKCECERISHKNHLLRKCNKQLSLGNRGREEGWGCWEAHHKTSTGGDTLGNCEILCWDCHQQTF